MPDHYVLVEGGLVQNSPALPVFDLDVIGKESVADAATVEEVFGLLDEANRYEVEYVRNRCLDWLDQHGIEKKHYSVTVACGIHDGYDQREAIERAGDSSGWNWEAEEAPF